MMKLSKKILLAILMICMTNLAYMQTNDNKRKNRLYAKMELQKKPVYFPLPSKSFKRISSGYGMRKHPILKKNKFHYGLDLAARKGTPIYASAHGKVVKAEFSSGYGNYVVIDHDYGYKTLYGHMMVSKVKINQKVKQGAIIGFVGSTGRSTGPHLHYEILKKNKKIDPFSYWMSFLKKMEVKRF
ncbi:M23 family metallopeptidase [Zobellia galactanivorans]|uniref:Metallopeptidase, family M23 n=1 Tax=Zobellia galactanivorans (strain DSM 12802 / CCUG 47099 / CIP 106680 / NCIMB 13871 / Dsij) TaxID=63186 RepID=G0KZX3_ZOBGA|nr:M23 family metallopeptidase [Zobellia galactanivorans]MBU3027541.1 M23 family metallopeptidase [Zobellia galactanivorans]CAZ97238.1 Metallopeptidase, family M23 [Zobellia galactanivorans]